MNMNVYCYLNLTILIRIQVFEMRLSFKSDYAIRALLYLAHRHQTDQLVPLNQISDAETIPFPYLEQIMLQLKKYGWVDSKRGNGGGYFLARHPTKITVGEVVRHLDGPVDPDAGLPGNSVRSSADQRALREVWAEVTRGITNVVDAVTFADLMRRSDELNQTTDVFDYTI